MALQRGQEAYDRFERAMQVPMLVLSILFLPVLLVPEVVDVSEGVEASLAAISWMIWGAFVFEFTGLLLLAPDRARMVRTHLLDLAIIVLPFLRPLRAGQALRALKVVAVIGRIGVGIRRLHTPAGFAGFSLVVVSLIVGGGLLAFTFERAHPDSTIDSAGDGLWWALVTTTTVGYGDEFPVTPEGRGIATVLMLVGIALLSVVTANIAAFFVSNDEAADHALVVERLDRIESALAAVVVSAELERLATLRDRGVLTDDELASQKQRVLAGAAALATSSR